MSAKQISAASKYSFEGKIGFTASAKTQADGKIGGKIGFAEPSASAAKCVDGKIGKHIDVTA